MIGAPNVKRYLCLLWLALPVFAQDPQLNRIAGRIDPSRAVALKGNIHPKARPVYDRGPVSPNLNLDYVTLRFKPAPAQQADLDRFLADLQNRGSGIYHRWLTPEQYADRFGASNADIAQVVSWLEGQGLTVVSKARGRNFVVFKGTAAAVEAALHVEIHQFVVDGETHYANVNEPSVPAAIQPFTAAILGLNDFRLKPPRSNKPVPATNYDGMHVLGAEDLWTIYDTYTFYNHGWNGAGLKLAVIGQSDVNLSDMAAYQTDFGLPSNPPVKLLVPGVADPGIVSGDSGESDLDLEMSGAMAPGAQIVFVYSPTVADSVQYAIDQAVAPVVSYSYGGCEVDQTTAIATAYQSLAQQGNAEGITWLASSGDFGAAACDGNVALAVDGISVMLPASIPEVTGVGGTTFSEGNGGYWDSSSTGYGTALSYIPEVAWNDTTVTGKLSASGGGMSILFPRPTWQSAPGVQKLNVRFVPDVAMSASPQHDPYLVIENGTPSLVGGTSASTPLFAGIVLLMSQYLSSNGLGNINPGLYELASVSGNVCSTVSVTPSCVFHDVSGGGNLVPCEAGTNGCIGGYLGYAAAVGYDMVTGLGSVDGANLTLAWQAASQPAITQIFNAASFVDTGLSPGLIFSIKGSGLGPTPAQPLEIGSDGRITDALSGIEVLVNGTPAPLLYVSQTQINAVAPYEIASMTGQRVNIQVINNGIASATITDNVVSAAPAMFNLGNNAAAVINQDGTVNGAGNPAARGTYVSIYATGEGQTSPPGLDGFIPTSAANLSAPVAGVAVYMNQFSAKVLYAGTASFDGFFQVNAVVPTSLSPGTVPITLTVGGVASPTLNMFVK